MCAFDTSASFSTADSWVRVSSSESTIAFAESPTAVTSGLSPRTTKANKNGGTER